MTQNTIKSQVAEFIKNNPGLRASEIARGVGTKPGTAGTALTALLKSRLIGKVGKPGFYHYYPAQELSTPDNFGISQGMQLLNVLMGRARG